jgi:hypothetical protein
MSPRTNWIRVSNFNPHCVRKGKGKITGKFQDL